MKKSRIVFFALSAFTLSTAFAYTPNALPTNKAASLIKSHKKSVYSLADLTSLLHKKYAFTLRDPKSGGIVYSTRGEFMLSGQGESADAYIVQAGKRLQGYQEGTDLLDSHCSLSDIKVVTELPPVATTSFKAALNLNAAEPIPTSPFNPNDVNTYNFTLASPFYDQLGSLYDVHVYFVKQQANDWNAYVLIDQQIISHGQLHFDAAGRLTSTEGLSDVVFTSPTNGGTQTFGLDFDGTSQFATSTFLRSLSTDGHELLGLANVSVDELGFVNAEYAQGVTQPVGKIAISPLR